jgi:hypothetical protein
MRRITFARGWSNALRIFRGIINLLDVFVDAPTFSVWQLFMNFSSFFEEKIYCEFQRESTNKIKIGGRDVMLPINL